MSIPFSPQICTYSRNNSTEASHLHYSDHADPSDGGKVNVPKDALGQHKGKQNYPFRKFEGGSAGKEL